MCLCVRDPQAARDAVDRTWAAGGCSGGTSTKDEPDWNRPTTSTKSAAVMDAERCFMFRMCQRLCVCDFLLSYGDAGRLGHGASGRQTQGEAPMVVDDGRGCPVPLK